MHTSNVMKGELVVDGALLWSAEKAGTGIVNDCGSQANTVDFLAYVSHKDGSLTLDFSGTMASVGAGQGAFGILSLVVTPMTIGREKYSRESAISDFSAGPDGFLAPANFQRTTCDSPLGTILGGDKTDSPGVVVEKTWTDLPAHKMILVAFTYVYLGGWDAARIGTCKADDAVVWSSKRADAFGPTSTACAGMATKTTRGTALLSHDADELTLTFGSTGNVHNQEEFGKPSVGICGTAVLCLVLVALMLLG